MAVLPWAVTPLSQEALDISHDVCFLYVIIGFFLGRRFFVHRGVVGISGIEND